MKRTGKDSTKKPNRQAIRRLFFNHVSVRSYNRQISSMNSFRVAISNNRFSQEKVRPVRLKKFPKCLEVRNNMRTFALLSNPDSGLLLQSDEYILNDLLRELEV